MAHPVIPLYNLATDCLWLSMHFFHPIQQCAQQVYHTALPLSPTSSELHKHHIQSITDDQLSHVTAFSGAPGTWGLLIRTINIRPRQLTCIATSVQRIIAACEDMVDIYGAVTFVLQQSLHTAETVTKIQGSPDGSCLFFAHYFSVTMWDVQTGGPIHAFTTKSKINDIAVSVTGDHIACGTSDGSVVFRDIHTKESTHFGNGQPVEILYWLSPLELVVATDTTVYCYNITMTKIMTSSSIPGRVWGMVHLGHADEFLVGTLQPRIGGGQKLSFLRTRGPRQSKILLSMQPSTLGPTVPELVLTPPPMHPKGLLDPILVDNNVVCMTPLRGVQLFDTRSYHWTTNPPLLDKAISVVMPLNRNIVVQTKDSIQIFSVDVLASCEVHNSVRLSHIYPLGKKHIVCFLQPERHPTLLELETLQEIRPANDTSPLTVMFMGPVTTQAQFHETLGAVLTDLVALEVPFSGLLPEWTGVAGEDAPLSGLSPGCTQIATVYNAPQLELHVRDARDGIILASLPLKLGEFGVGKVYDLIFESETRFNLKIDGPGWHVQIPYNIIPSLLGPHPYMITKGEPVPLSESQPTPPYTLDENCEWVLDAESRRICWISPQNLWRGSGGHFWVGLSLVMVGDDGIVRKLTFKDPDC